MVIMGSKFVSNFYIPSDPTTIWFTIGVTFDTKRSIAIGTNKNSTLGACRTEHGTVLLHVLLILEIGFVAMQGC
jgi:hypothetical protein